MNASKSRRPNAVVAFEVLGIVVLGFELAFVSEFTWFDLVWIPLMLWIIFSVTRRRSSVARWLFTAIYGGGFALAAFVAAVGLVKSSDMEWTGWTLSVAALAQLALLWSPGASLYLASQYPKAPRGAPKS